LLTSANVSEVSARYEDTNSLHDTSRQGPEQNEQSENRTPSCYVSVVSQNKMAKLNRKTHTIAQDIEVKKTASQSKTVRLAKKKNLKDIE
jgi:hypothetical protein